MSSSHLSEPSSGVAHDDNIEYENGLYISLKIRLDSQDLRLLSLLPGGWEQEIRCEMRLLSLDEASSDSYKTLSYTWGDPEIRKPVVVNGYVVWITTNLEAALRHIRKPDEALTIWADALCIDQSNIPEKSHQVGMMSEIFERSSLVYIWLGCPDEPSMVECDPFNFLNHFADSRHYFELPGYSYNEETKMHDFQENDYFSSMWNNFCLIAKSPWWTRSWTVQEIILPPTAIVIYSHWRTPWSRIESARVAKNNHLIDLDGCCIQARETLPKHFRTFFDGFFSTVQYINDRGKPYKEGILGDFHSTVRSFADRQCKDPRDKIFSLSALASPTCYANNAPDYSKSTGQVYTETYRRMVDESGGDFRCILGRGFNSLTLDQPSWVRDFSTVLPPDILGSELRRAIIYPLYDASHGIQARVTYTEQLELEVEGISVGTVSDVGLAVKSYGKDDLKTIFKQWLGLARRVYNSLDEDSVIEALSRLMTADVVNDAHAISVTGTHWRRATVVDLPEHKTWLQFLDGDRWAPSGPLHGGVEAAINGRALFLTQRGSLGLCIPDAMPGDEVWVLFGSRVPFILRPHAILGPSDGRHYSLIGDCYLHGMMDGEAMVHDDVKSIGCKLIIK